jgi:hypothetical protein
VLLDSVQAVDFVQSSIRRNMNFVPMSSHEQTAEISGDGYPEPPEGVDDQEFALIVSQMLQARLITKKPDNVVGDRPGGDGQFSTGSLASKYDARVYQPPTGLFGNFLGYLLNLISQVEIQYEWFWVMDAYRKTEFALKAGEKKYEIYQPAGSFGYIGEHEGLVSSWDQSVTAAPGDEDRLQAAPNSRNGYRMRVPNGGSARLVTRLEATEFSVPFWMWLLLLLLPILIILWLILGS